MSHSLNYFGDRSILIITVPGLHHESVAVNSQHVIRQALYDQGFYWPAWGNIHHIVFTGSANQSVSGGNKQSSIQPDGGLAIPGQKMPFMVIEVADTETYQHVRAKARHVLHHAKGQIRFAVIIDLIRGTIEAPQRGSNSSSDCDRSLPGSPTPVHEAPGCSKRPARDSDSSASKMKSHKKFRRETSDSSSPSTAGDQLHGGENTSSRKSTAPTDPPGNVNPAVPLLIDAIYSAANVTVFAIKLVDSPSTSGGKRRVITTPVDAIECWPAMPGLDSEFTFTWADMGVKEYPAELRDRTFTISWGWLNTLIAHLCAPPTNVPIVDEGEASSEGTDVLTSEEESASDAVSEGQSDGSWKE